MYLLFTVALLYSDLNIITKHNKYLTFFLSLQNDFMLWGSVINEGSLPCAIEVDS